MENPVTISTGVSYERQSIKKWLFTYKKTTCPATMQPLRNFDLIPNHTLKSLILSWRNQRHLLNSSPSSSSSFHGHTELTSLLSAVESSPFKVSSLKKLRSFARENSAAFVASGGIEALRRVILRSAADSDYFSAFQDCEEALGVLDGIPFENDDASVGLLAAPDSLGPMLLVLQRGGAEARLHAISILQRISRADPSVTDHFHQDIDVFKSLLDLLSDEISASPKLSSSSLDLLLEAVAISKPNLLRAVEAGAVRVLIELLPDAGRHREGRVLMLLKRLCECAEGRSAFADHGMGVAAVASKIGRDGRWGRRLG
ncbi:hypothetical protein HPP92_014533 [Vanilla planifolia]|uniref:U-box domain-containing protein n=1 Tax=Vanilla planifolia TaxID=51239 RepID=A0A835UUU9_VANPL|nr:hypothetical protein HPP92_014533 [Vanilla planifolia]